MGRVLVGAVLGAILGGLLGAWPAYSGATFQLFHPVPGGTAQQTVNLGHILHWFSIIIGAGAGGIIGAIAGATSANPQTKPIPLWFLIVLVVLVILVLLLCVAIVVWGFLPREIEGRHDVGPDPQEQRQPLPQGQPQNRQPPEGPPEPVPK